VQSLADIVIEQTKLRDRLTGQGVGLSSKAVDGLLAAKLDPMAVRYCKSCKSNYD